MIRNIVLVCAVCVASCDGREATQSPAVAAAQDSQQNSRLVSVYLQSPPNTGFIPVYGDRIVTAEPVTLVSVTRAKGKAIVQNIDTTIIGDSCSQLGADYPELIDCSEVNSMELEFEDIESTATTDAEGFAALYLGEHEKYRISVQSFVTTEDEKCFWGGSEILEQTTITLEMPVIVFCE